jgi:hypothetical protein
MHWRILLVAVLALFVAVSCDQQPVEPPTDQVLTAPTFNFMNGPANAGPRVFRYQDQWGAVGADSKKELMVFLGFDPREFCQDFIFEGTVVDFQEITNPQDASRLFLKVQGTAPGYVWAMPLAYGLDYCETVLVEDPIAEGPVRLRYTDNDVLWAGGNNTNSWVVSFKGETFSGQWRCGTKAPYDEVKCEEHINLR